MIKKITGQVVAGLLFRAHTHAELIAERVKCSKKQLKKGEISKKEHEENIGAIYYSEEDLLSILEAVGLPKPEWEKNLKKKK